MFLLTFALATPFKIKPTLILRFCILGKFKVVVYADATVTP